MPDYPTFAVPGDEHALAVSENCQVMRFGRPRRSAVMACAIPACSFVPMDDSAYCSTHRMQALFGQRETAGRL